MALIGPPELHLSATPTTEPATGNALVDAMVSQFNGMKLKTKPKMGRTENYSATFLSTGNPCLDLFFHVVPNTPPHTLTGYLVLAWEHDPLTTLKLVCNLRGVRGTGKSDKEGYYTAALWLHKLHPKTLACNVGPMAEFGYLKDWPEILYRILGIDDVWRRAIINRPLKPFRGDRSVRGLGGSRRGFAESKRIVLAKNVIARYNRDPDFKFLYDRVSDYFADCLRKDMELLSSGKGSMISLAAKWCPSLDSLYDEATLFCEIIARKVFPRAEYSEYDGVEDADYVYRVRDRLREEVLLPLRKVLDLPEAYIGAKDWGSIPYNKVGSLAMKNYKEKFLQHDKERFEEYLRNVKEGKATIAAGALLPHEIIRAIHDEDGGGEVAELQWKEMVADLSETGKLKNCLAVCDVSGSMRGVPMEVSIALGILVSELSEEPWKGMLVTYSEKPTLQRVLGDNLREKADFLKCMDWGGNNNFQKVFDLILEVAVNGNLSEDQMIKKLLVFSDMEFDQASANPWETDYMMIVKKFTEKGYGNCIPQIVFWNLRDSKATPVPGNQNGVALVSGFSKNLLALFLEGGDAMNPEAVMQAAIAGEEYNKLVVLD